MMFQRDTNIVLARQHLFVKVCLVLKVMHSENYGAGTHPSCEPKSQREADGPAEKLLFSLVSLDKLYSEVCHTCPFVALCYKPTFCRGQI